jgi:hypothetical protein
MADYVSAWDTSILYLTRPLSPCSTSVDPNNCSFTSDCISPYNFIQPSTKMVSDMTFDEAAHRKEIDETALRSESVRIPPAAHGKSNLEGQTQLPTSDSDVESGIGPIFSKWDSVDDSGNPRNWPTWKKIFHTAIPAMYGFVVSVPHSLI